MNFGTGTSARLSDRPVAGKTGTAQNYVDAWFCGYTPQLATCVWVGYPQGEIPLDSVEGVSPVFGGTIPAAIWRDFMTVAMQGKPVENFAVPSNDGHTIGPETPVPSPTPSPSPSPSESPSPQPTGPTGSDRHRPDRSHGADRTDGDGTDGTDRWSGRTLGRDGPDQVASLTLSSRLAGAMSTGRVATIVVPRPGVDRTTNVPLASSTRSRMDASPTRPICRNSRALALSKPTPSSTISTRSCTWSASTATVTCAACECLAAFRERLLHHAIGERLQVGGDLGADRSRELRSNPVFGAEARERLADRRDQPSLLQQGWAETRHQPAETVGLLGELLSDLGEDLDPAVGVARLDHQERGFEGE